MTTYSLTSALTDLSPVMRVAVVAQLRPGASRIVAVLRETPTTARGLLDRLGIADDDTDAIASVIVDLLQLRSFGLVARSDEGPAS